MLRRARALLELFGIDLLKAGRSIKGLQQYFRGLAMLRRQSRDNRLEFTFGRLYPCLDDFRSNIDPASGVYFHQDLLVARRIHANCPVTHVDVGSRIDGFVAHVAAFRHIKVIDVRPLAATIPNVTFKQADLTAPLDAALLDSCDSLSCLHALEHFGLGRYGEPVRHNGHALGLQNLANMLKRDGKLYLSVPIGSQRIEFNAHRIFSVRYLLKNLQQWYRLDRFSFIDDQGSLHEDVPMLETEVERNFGCHHGCGIFELTKLRGPASRSSLTAPTEPFS